jgi:hypothetical protein
MTKFLMARVPGLYETVFTPQHKTLANDFGSFINYESKRWPRSSGEQ